MKFDVWCACGTVDGLDSALGGPLGELPSVSSCASEAGSFIASGSSDYVRDKGRPSLGPLGRGKNAFTYQEQTICWIAATGKLSRKVS
jgi:hypothetical protein